METPDGRPAGVSISLARREVDPAKGQVEERVLSLRQNQPAREFTTVIRPQGSKATISSGEGEILGQAELSGPAWEWTGMKFSSKAGPMRVDGEDRFVDGGMSAEKRVFGADGKLQLVIHENGHSISSEAYELLRQRLLTH